MWRFTFLVLLWCPGSKSGSNIFMKKGGKKNTLCMRKTTNNHGTFFQLTAKSGFSQKVGNIKWWKRQEIIQSLFLILNWTLKKNLVLSLSIAIFSDFEICRMCITSRHPKSPLKRTQKVPNQAYKWLNDVIINCTPHTLFGNHLKCLIWILAFCHFSLIFVL